MKKSVSPWYAIGIALWLAIFATVVIFHVNVLFSTSIDIGLHGTLVSRLMESWQLPQADENLAEMANYPRFGHGIASIVGKMVGSAMTGMQVVAIGSAFLLWSMVGIGLGGLPVRRFLAAIAALTAAVVICRLSFSIEIFGNELVSTYFFSHLVSQSLAMAALVFALRSEGSGTSQLFPYAILGLSAPLLVSVHLLPAVETLGVLAILVALNALSPWSPRRKFTAWWGVGIVLASTLLTVVNPNFLAMVKLSANDGGVLLHYASSLTSVLILAAIVALISCFMIVLWWRGQQRELDFRHLLLKYFGVLGLAIAGLCFLQFVLYELYGQASPYACFKYVIGLQTVLLIDTAVLVAMLVGHAKNSRLPGVSLVASGLLAAVACICVFSGPVALSTDALVSAERQVRALAIEKPRINSGKYDLAIAIDDVPPIGSYFISRGILGSPSLGISLDVLSGRMPSPMDQVARIFTSPESRPWDIPECRQGSSEELVVVDAACALSSMGTLKCQNTIQFSDRGALDKVTTGFPNASTEGRWSEGSKASFTCELSEPRPGTAYLSAAGLISETHSQRMIVSVNGGPTQTIEFSTRSASSTTRIPLPTASSRTLEFRFDFPDATSPAELGMNADQRTLAVLVYNIRFE